MQALRALGVAVVFALFAPIAVAEVNPAPAPRVTFAEKEHAIDVLLDGKSIATYVSHDDQIQRPYFSHVKTPSGMQVTRNLPPVKGSDPEDHATMHPGIWMAFSDLGGLDFWRNKGPRVVEKKHVRAEDKPMLEMSNEFLDGEQVICRESLQITFVPRPVGYLLIWDSTLEPQVDGLWMADPEEMGLGVRVATPMAVKSGKGGRITSSTGGENERGTWGKVAEWCDYSGTIDGKHAGVTLMSAPGNDRKPWFHTRDYGLMVANPFGERTGAPKRLMLEKAKSLNMRFGILVHESKDAAGVDLAAEYAAFSKLEK